MGISFGYANLAGLKTLPGCQVLYATFYFNNGKGSPVRLSKYQRAAGFYNAIFVIFTFEFKTEIPWVYKNTHILTAVY